MKLDKRIKDNRIGDCFTTEEFTKYLTQPCYFANSIDDYKDLKSCKYANLVLIAQDRASAYYTALNDADSWKFCLPAAYVEPRSEQKTLRPFRTVKELPFTVGDKIYFKGKGLKPYVYTIVSALNFNSNGALAGINFGCSEMIDTEDLFNDYEWKFGLDCEWRPFGVEE